MVLGLEVPASITSITCSDPMIWSCVTWISSCNNFTDLKLIIQGAAGYRKCITFTVSQNLEMIGDLKVVKAAM
jgi:hypothetical protein